MKREIIFRGKVKYIAGLFGHSKDKADGEWVYGDLERHRIDDLVRIHCYNEDKTYYRQYDVDPDTVGQFTGLTDKNGRAIYEGDLVMIPRVPKGKRKSRMVKHVVECDKYSTWSFHSLEKDVLTLMMANHSDFDSYKFEVIGNIYDDEQKELH